MLGTPNNLIHLPGRWPGPVGTVGPQPAARRTATGPGPAARSFFTDPPMPANLYAVAHEIAALLADDGGELPPGVEGRLDALEMALETKAENLCRYVQQLAADAVAYRGEAARLAGLASAAAAKAERLKAYLRASLETAGVTKLSTELFVVSVCKNSQPTVRLDEGAAVPAAYQRVTIELDKAAVAADWKAGKSLPAGIACEVHTHLRIK
jgi:hypothetical protein